MYCAIYDCISSTQKEDVHVMKIIVIIIIADVYVFLVKTTIVHKCEGTHCVYIYVCGCRPWSLIPPNM